MSDVLIVDSRAGVCRTAAETLRSSGHQVCEVMGSSEALEQLARRSFDLVVSGGSLSTDAARDLCQACWRSHPDTGLMVIDGSGVHVRRAEFLSPEFLPSDTESPDVSQIGDALVGLVTGHEARPPAGDDSATDLVANLIRELAACSDATEIVTRAIGHVQRALDAAGTRLVLYEREGGADAQSVSLVRGCAALLGKADDERRRVTTMNLGERCLLFDKDGRPVALPSPSVLCLTVPLVAENELLGAMSVSRSRDGLAFDASDVEMARWLAATIAYSVQEAYAGSERTRSNREGPGRVLSEARSLLQTVRVHDHYTYQHSVRVADLGRRLAIWAGLGPEQMERVRMGSLLHDVGKLGVSRRTLLKSGSLTPLERAEIRRHPEMGARILSRVGALNQLLPGVLHHHEWPNGAGYPDGLRGGEIPLEARIIAIADVYDSLLFDRPYRAALSRDEVAEYVRHAAGAQLDVGLVRTFLAHISKDGARATLA